MRLDAEVGETRRERTRGLLGRAGLPKDGALLLEHARSIHTFGMRFAIDAVLLDAEMTVLEVRHLRPWRLLLPRRHVRHVLECAESVDLRRGDRLASYETSMRASP